MSLSATVTRIWTDGQTGASITKSDTISGTESLDIDLPVPGPSTALTFALAFDYTKLQAIMINADVTMTVHLLNSGASIDIVVTPNEPYVWTTGNAAASLIVRAPTSGTVDSAGSVAGTLQIRAILNVH